MSDYVTLGQTFKNDSVIKPQKKELFSEEAYDFPEGKWIGGQEDDAAE
jgi:hypothetical protein